MQQVIPMGVVTKFIVLREGFVKLDFRQLTAWFLTLGAGLFLLSGCAPQSELKDTKGSVKVLIPDTSEKGSSLNVVQLLGIENIQTLKGKYAEFYLSPRVDESTIAGKPAVARFMENSSGTLVPANESTKQLAVVYFHTQKLAALDEEVGAFGINKWPRKIGVGVRIKGGGKNNAFYDGNTDSLLVVPYDQNDLPVGINPGILAHEHFHSLFYKIVLKSSSQKNKLTHDIHSVAEGTDLDLSARVQAHSRTEKTKVTELSDEKLQDLYNSLLLRSLNEGLADFWGWMYTGDPDFIALSIPSQKARRSLKSDDIFKRADLPMSETLKDRIRLFSSKGIAAHLNQYIIGYSYEVGTQVSRFLKAYTEVYAIQRNIENLQARKDVAKQVVNLLPFLKSYAEGKVTKEFEFKDFVLEFSGLMGELTQKECEYLSRAAIRTQTSGDISFKCELKEKSYKVVEDSEASDDNG